MAIPIAIAILAYLLMQAVAGMILGKSLLLILSGLGLLFYFGTIIIKNPDIKMLTAGACVVITLITFFF